MQARCCDKGPHDHHLRRLFGDSRMVGLNGQRAVDLETEAKFRLTPDVDAAGTPLEPEGRHQYDRDHHATLGDRATPHRPILSLRHSTARDNRPQVAYAHASANILGHLQSYFHREPPETAQCMAGRRVDRRAGLRPRLRPCCLGSPSSALHETSFSIRSASAPHPSAPRAERPRDGRSRRHPGLRQHDHARCGWKVELTRQHHYQASQSAYDLSSTGCAGPLGRPAEAALSASRFRGRLLCQLPAPAPRASR